MTMSMIKYFLTWIAFSFLNLFIDCLMTLGYVMTNWFNFQLQAITHKNVERQVIKSLKKIETV